MYPRSWRHCTISTPPDVPWSVALMGVAVPTNHSWAGRSRAAPIGFPAGRLPHQVVRSQHEILHDGQPVAERLLRPQRVAGAREVVNAVSLHYSVEERDLGGIEGRRRGLSGGHSFTLRATASAGRRWRSRRRRWPEMGTIALRTVTLLAANINFIAGRPEPVHRRDSAHLPGGRDVGPRVFSTPSRWPVPSSSCATNDLDLVAAGA